MPILDSIQAAEKKAEQMRSEATEKVRVLLENTRFQSELKAKQLFEEADIEDKKIMQDHLIKISAKEKEINSVYKKIDQDLRELADSKMDSVSDLIVKKVFEL